MVQAAIHDFFRNIKLESPAGTEVQILEADSTVDTLTLQLSNGIAFSTTNSTTDTFGLDVNYSISVPIGTTEISLTDVNASTSIVNFAGSSGINVTRTSSSELNISVDSITESQISDLQDYILLTSISTTTASASGSGSLSYNNTNGVFTFTPPDLSTYIDLTDLSVTTAAASGSGSLSYNNTNGVFTFTPPDLSTYIDLTDLSVVQNPASGSGQLTYNNTTGVFTYTPPDFLAAEINDLTAAVVWANVPDSNITQSSVTQHQAALSITESQISDLQDYILLSDLSVVTAAPASTGSFEYNNLTGVFTYTPPDPSSFITAEADTLNDVTNRNPVTSNTITVGGIVADSVTISDNQITSNVSNADLELAASGTGEVSIIGSLKVNGTSFNNTDIDNWNNAYLLVNTLNSSGSGVSYFIPENEVSIIGLYKQEFFTLPIEIEGTLQIDGILIEI